MNIERMTLNDTDIEAPSHKAVSYFHDVAAEIILTKKGHEDPEIISFEDLDDKLKELITLAISQVAINFVAVFWGGGHHGESEFTEGVVKQFNDVEYEPQMKE